jgi:hypothetical protein
VHAIGRPQESQDGDGLSNPRTSIRHHGRGRTSEGLFERKNDPVSSCRSDIVARPIALDVRRVSRSAVLDDVEGSEAVVQRHHDDPFRISLRVQEVSASQDVSVIEDDA